MRRLTNKILAATIALFFVFPGVFPASAGSVSPEGKWRTRDIQTGVPTYIVEIYKNGDEVAGRIVELLNEPADTKCTRCPGDLQNQPLVGMTILKGLKPHGEAWAGGAILRPLTGASAHAAMEIDEEGNKLRIIAARGPISLSQVWERVE